MNVSKSFPVEPYYVSGYVDHRGKITARIDWQKHQGLLSKAKNKMAVLYLTAKIFKGFINSSCKISRISTPHKIQFA